MRICLFDVISTISIDAIFWAWTTADDSSFSLYYSSLVNLQDIHLVATWTATVDNLGRLGLSGNDFGLFMACCMLSTLLFLPDYYSVSNK